MLMASFREEEENGFFFDASEDIASITGSDSEPADDHHLDDYDVWIRAPTSVTERRSSFFRRMGMESDRCRISSGNFYGDNDEKCRFRDFDRAVTGSCGSHLGLEDEDSVFRERDSRSEMEEDFEEEEEDQEDFEEEEEELEFDRARSRVRSFLNGGIKSESFSGSPASFKKGVFEGAIRKVQGKWLSKLKSMTCIVDGQPNETDHNRVGPNWSRAQRVKVKQCNKRSKELSALYTGQNIRAHVGPILTMKFSPDGQYLASAGEDKVVRVWRVSEEDRSNELDTPELDHSCLYFTVNQTSEVKPLLLERERLGKSISMKKTSDSACVVFPPKVFRISERPLHEFQGHLGKVLDLSWSNNNCLLSASEDETVRLWRVGFDHCVKVFSHSNYVTCVQFNPVDDNYFISGSIDGKVRIWGIPGCQVVDWTDIREIVTAVCYRPNGEGGIVGSIAGSCRFYNISDNRLQLDAQICLNSKKKSLCRKITGFQFSPQDMSIVMVTCADSQVRVLHGLNVIGKYRGVRNAGNQISASFTSDGKHIVSASEDSSVFLWSCDNDQQVTTATVQSNPNPKSIRSCERFSTNALVVAVPWNNNSLHCGTHKEAASRFHLVDKFVPESLPFSSFECFSINQDFFLESFPKASATWPEEKLPARKNPAATMRKSQLKFLKASCKNTTGSHAWGMVIVTAGWDGRIRSFHNYGLPINS